MLHTVLKRACPRLSLLAPLQQTSLYSSVQIVVPALGDSISDGTIATVLKKAGDEVAENETIAQVETDKVTIDIKAPSEGTILGVVVQEQDTVLPGQLVATLDDTAAKAKLVGGTPAPTAADPQPPAAAAPAPAPPAAAPASSGSGSHHRVPGIRFPPRVTADGRRVSALPAAEAAAITQQWSAAAGHQHQHAAAAAAPAAAGGAQSSSSSGQGAARAAAQQQQQQGSSPSAANVPSKFATSVTRLPGMPQRRELSAKDIELIELGGAAP